MVHAGDVFEKEMREKNEKKDSTAAKSEIPINKWRRMREKYKKYYPNLVYVAIAALAILIIWLRFKGWSTDTYVDTIQE